MQAIHDNVFIEDSYPGVTLGVIARPRGLIQLDSPPAPEDGRSWRASLMNLNSGHERVLINMDSHPDRTFGARGMDCTIIANEKTAAIFRARPSTFKAQGDETGADWESIPGLGSVRWAAPEISFDQQLTLYWGESPVILESHPGPTAGAIWVILPDEKIVFVGDAVLKHQPPFLANANLDQWLESLDVLMSPAFKGYIVVSGRGGVVTTAMVKAQYELTEHINDKLYKFSTKKSPASATDKLAETLSSGFKAPAARHKQFTSRLRYGLQHYFTRHYHSGYSDEE
jgi:glyoxylase-like metal-dependent hydrolase (beta-lactamase superfamily II)